MRDDANEREPDEEFMQRALALAAGARRIAPPNPWVGALLVSEDGVVLAHGATRAPGESHAEVVALDEAGDAARGATLYVTLEPCCHVGRTGPCTERIIDAGVARVVVGLLDPDTRVSGAGVRRLQEAGIAVSVGMLSGLVERQLAPYLWHRRTGHPYVVAKVAATLDGRVAMADGSSKWITSDEARHDAHELRADSQAVLVGAGTVRADDPELTARLGRETWSPLRVVLGKAPEGARVHPCVEYSGALGPLLDDLGQRGVLQLVVEGGPRTTSSFLEAGLVQRLVWYVAPALAGSRDTLGALSTLSTPTMSGLRRARVVAHRQIGEDIRIDLEV